MATGHFCLKWNNFHNSIVTAFESLQSTEELVDVTLMCEGRNVKAHKVILSACSPYFRNLFKETPCKHPIIILKDVLYCDLVAILQFMYQGEVLVDQDGLASFLKTAELLQVSGLAGSTSSTTAALSEETTNKNASPPPKTETITPILRPKSPSSPKPPAPQVKVRNDIVPIEPVIEKENIITRECDDEPMQSCSYQTPENVIIKTESVDDQDFNELDYLDPIDDPGSTTTEEQSILERSLKAQGDSLCTIKSIEELILDHQIVEPISQQNIDRTELNMLALARRRNSRPKRYDNYEYPNDGINYSKFPSRRPINCPNCNRCISQARSLKTHLSYCKLKQSKIGGDHRMKS